MSDAKPLALPSPDEEHPHKTFIRQGLRRHLMIGGLAFCALVFGLGGMAAGIAGNMAMGVYMLIQLWSLPPNPTAKDLLLRRTA